MSKRIVILQLLEALVMGGAENYGVQLSNYLAETQRYNVHIAHGPGTQFWKPSPNIQLHQYNIHRGQSLLIQLQDLRLVAWFRQLIQHNNIQLVHYHSFTAPLYASIAAQMLGVPTIYTPMTIGARGFVQRLQYPKYGLLNKVIDRLINRYVVLSKYFEYEYVSQRGVPEHKVDVNWLGVDTVKFVPAVNKAALRQRLGWPADKFVFIVVARLHPNKRIHLAIEAFARAFNESDKAVEMRILGDGLVENELRSLAAKLGVAKKVIFCGRSNNLQTIYPAADTYMVTTVNPNLGLATLEAMACGLALLTYTDDGRPEQIQMAQDTCIHGKNGYHANNIDDMAQKMSELVQNPELAQAMGKVSRERAETKFDQTLHYNKMEEIYAMQLGMSSIKLQI